MTPNEIITVARRFLRDQQAPFRGSDDELKKNLVFAVRELNRIRPETRYVGGVLTDGVEVPQQADAEIAIGERYEECLAYYVAYLCYLDDDADTANAPSC